MAFIVVFVIFILFSNLDAPFAISGCSVIRYFTDSGNSVTYESDIFTNPSDGCSASGCTARDSNGNANHAFCLPDCCQCKCQYGYSTYVLDKRRCYENKGIKNQSWTDAHYFMGQTTRDPLPVLDLVNTKGKKKFKTINGPFLNCEGSVPTAEKWEYRDNSEWKSHVGLENQFQVELNNNPPHENVFLKWEQKLPASYSGRLLSIWFACRGEERGKLLVKVNGTLSVDCPVSSTSVKPTQSYFASSTPPLWTSYSHVGSTTGATIEQSTATIFASRTTTTSSSSSPSTTTPSSSLPAASSSSSTSSTTLTSFSPISSTVETPTQTESPTQNSQSDFGEQKGGFGTRSSDSDNGVMIGAICGGLAAAVGTMCILGMVYKKRRNRGVSGCWGNKPNAEATSAKSATPLEKHSGPIYDELDTYEDPASIGDFNNPAYESCERDDMKRRSALGPLPPIPDNQTKLAVDVPQLYQPLNQATRSPKGDTLTTESSTTNNNDYLHPDGSPYLRIRTSPAPVMSLDPSWETDYDNYLPESEDYDNPVEKQSKSTDVWADYDNPVAQARNSLGGGYDDPPPTQTEDPLYHVLERETSF